MVEHRTVSVSQPNYGRAVIATILVGLGCGWLSRGLCLLDWRLAKQVVGKRS